MKLDNDFIEFIKLNPDTVVMRESTTYPGLFVLKYHRKVFYKALWNEYYEELRGLVVDKDWNIVVQPFKKIYNISEQKDAPRIYPYDSVRVVEKVNGFMAAVTNTKDYGVIVSTTGSLDSDFVGYAKDMLPLTSQLEMLPYDHTVLFEIVHPEDPHIIPEVSGAYLIGVRKHGYTNNMWNEEMLDYLASQFPTFKRPKHFKCTFKQARNLAKMIKHEGFVIRQESTEYAVKIKSPYYLFTKFFARKGTEKLAKLLEQGVESQSIRELDFMEEEFYGLLEYIINDKENFMSLTEQGRIRYVEKYFGLNSFGL